MSYSPRITPVPLEEGKPTTLKFNRPVKFRITFVRGTTIEGIIPPNSGFTICSQGDIDKFEVIIDDDSVRKLGLIEPEAEGSIKAP